MSIGGRELPSRPDLSADVPTGAPPRTNDTRGRELPGDGARDASALVSGPPPSPVLLTDATTNLPDADDGADDEADSDAGDKVLPLELQPDEPREDPKTPLTPDRARLEARLNDAALRARVLRYVLRGNLIAKDVAEDITSDTFVRALRAQTWPEESRPLYPWLRRYAYYQRLRFQRGEYRRELREQPVEDIDQRAVEGTPRDERVDDLERIKQRLRARSARDAETHDMFEQHVVQDQPMEAVAAQAQIATDAAYRRVQRFTLDIRKMWRELSAASAVVIILCLLGLQLHHEDPTAWVEPTPRAADPLPPVPPPATAAQLRERGLVLCGNTQYKACLRLLDRAAAGDPDGEKDPKVVAARRKADDVLYPPDKPGLPH